MIFSNQHELSMCKTVPNPVPGPIKHGKYCISLWAIIGATNFAAPFLFSNTKTFWQFETIVCINTRGSTAQNFTNKLVLDAYQHQYIGGILTIASTDNETLTFGIILKNSLIFFYYVKINKMLAAQHWLVILLDLQAFSFPIFLLQKELHVQYMVHRMR